jgi:nitrogen fixation protein NifU and related proteins
VGEGHRFGSARTFPGDGVKRARNALVTPEHQAADVNLSDVYRQIVLEHSRSPRNKGVLEGATVVERGVNPSCGDDIELQLRLEDQRILEARFTGVGCAISQASASLMTLALEGKTVSEALALARDFHAMLRGEALSESLGDVSALQGVAKLHARVKCASLPWQTLEVALRGSSKECPTSLE